MNKGEVAQFGTPEELLNIDGFYSQIYQVQVAIENEILH